MVVKIERECICMLMGRPRSMYALCVPGACECFYFGCVEGTSLFLIDKQIYVSFDKNKTFCCMIKIIISSNSCYFIDTKTTVRFFLY